MKFYFLYAVSIAFCIVIGVFFGQIPEIFDFKDSNFRYVFHGGNILLAILIFQYIRDKFLTHFENEK